MIDDTDKQDVYGMTDDQRYWYDFGGTKAALSLLSIMFLPIIAPLFLPDQYEVFTFVVFGIIGLITLRVLNPNSRLNRIDRRIAIAARNLVDQEYEEIPEESDGTETAPTTH